jgi:hypothetical protein
MSTVGQQLFFQITAGLWSTLEPYRAQAAAKFADKDSSKSGIGALLRVRLMWKPSMSND